MALPMVLCRRLGYTNIIIVDLDIYAALNSVLLEIPTDMYGL